MRRYWVSYCVHILIAFGAGLIASAPANAVCLEINLGKCVNYDNIETFTDGGKLHNRARVDSYIQTFGENVVIINSGYVGEDIRAYGKNSTLINKGWVGRDLVTYKEHSKIRNSGFVAGGIKAFAAYTPIFNSGKVKGNIQSFNRNSQITNSGSVFGAINAFGKNSAVFNTGKVSGDIQTYSAKSAIINHGLIGGDARTFGDRSGIRNTGKVARDIQTFGIRSTITNKGAVARDLQTFGVNSAIFNSGRVGRDIQAFKRNSIIRNSGVVGRDIQTFNTRSAITNFGKVGRSIQTFGTHSRIRNFGQVEKSLQTFSANSLILNTGNVKGDIQTFGENSGITNVGNVGETVQTFKNNSGVKNRGRVGSNIQVFGDNSTVVNSGTVGTGKKNDGIFLFGKNPTLTLLAGSTIRGTINLEGKGRKTLNVARGTNLFFTFKNSPNLINTYGQPFVISENRVAVFNPTGLKAQDRMMSELTSSISSSINLRLGGVDSRHVSGLDALITGSVGETKSQRSASSSQVLADTLPEIKNQGFWGQVFFGGRTIEASAESTGISQAYSGLVIGLDGWRTENTNSGVFGGFSQSELKTSFDAQRLRANTYFGGVYNNYKINRWTLKTIVTAGYSDNQSLRKIVDNKQAGGQNSAQASFNGIFVSPEISATTNFDVGRFKIAPTIQVRYTHYWLDGYQESGSSDNLTVNRRQLSQISSRAQIAIENDGPLTPRLGAEFNATYNGVVTGTLLGQSIAINSSAWSNQIAFFAGATLSGKISEGISGFVDGEMQWGQEGQSRYDVRAGLKIEF